MIICNAELCKNYAKSNVRNRKLQEFHRFHKPTLKHMKPKSCDAVVYAIKRSVTRMQLLIEALKMQKVSKLQNNR